MNVSIFPENGAWLLVLNPTALDQSEADLGETPSPVSAFERCWTGEHWSDAPSEGQRYESKSDAATYLHEHWQRMENMAEALHDPIPTEFPIRGL